MPDITDRKRAEETLGESEARSGEYQMKHRPDLPHARFDCGERLLSIEKREGVAPTAKAFLAGFFVILGAGMAQAASVFFKESPLLAAKVEAGEMPPLAERLPRNPVLVELVAPRPLWRHLADEHARKRRSRSDLPDHRL